ncbi:hypothetical protein R1sor_020210 [Riccia sorocarpa]|uniref:J domain-containing protein n=1 Tax=Riccia sorocarpa TaxID=122646 RepID=A0ABD3IEN2_9MARC
MAAGATICQYDQRIGRVTTAGLRRSFVARKINVWTGLASNFNGVPLRSSRKAGHSEHGWKRRIRHSCSLGTGGSESCHVGEPVLTLYELLEIPQEVGPSEIKSAYRQMARRYHPDVCPPSAREECIRKFLQVQEAYEILVDPDLRADYDYRLKNPLSLQALTSGLAHDRKSGQRWRHDTTHHDVASKAAWKSQWEAQLGELRRSGHRKPGSWAERMRQKREEQGEGVA